MSFAGYDSGYYPRSRLETYYTSFRDTNAHSSLDSSLDASPYRPYISYEPRTPPPQARRSSPQHQNRRHTGRPTWPPSPSVEDETESLAKEVPSSAGSQVDHQGEPPSDTRGTVDQETLLDDIEQPPAAQDIHDRRFVLVSGPNIDGASNSSSSSSTLRDRRRKSVAERGNMAAIQTNMAEPPVFTERVSTPYAYTRPQKESVAPSPGAFLRSSDPLTPASSRVPKSVPSRDDCDLDWDQNTRPSRPPSSPNRHDSFSKPRPVIKNDAFDDCDLEPENTSHLRTERKPARYSFVNSDLQRDDLRASLRVTSGKPESTRQDSGPKSPPVLRRGDSSMSSKDSPYAQSPRSSSSSLNGGNRKPRPVPVDTDYSATSRTPSRPTSPTQRAPSPKLPTRLRESPPSSRPSSRGNTRPASPLSFSTTVRPPSPSHTTITDANWHSTYPPPVRRDRSRPPSRLGRNETMPVPAPRIDVHSPSPARPPQPQTSLPYPVDDFHTGVFMPPEEHYQFDHFAVNSPRQAAPETTRGSSSSSPGSPRLRDDAPSRPVKSNFGMAEELPRLRRPRSNSLLSTTSDDDRREKPSRKTTPSDLDQPLPSCPRATPSTRFADWYSLKGYPSFDICPACYEGVFRDTPFATDFTLRRRDERPTERYCDFSSPWLRLAWVLTIKQRRQTLNLLYRLIDIVDDARPCPGERELGTDRITWYGIPDQRDGVHVANFAICARDKRMIEILFPTMNGYFTKLPSAYRTGASDKYICGLRTSSRRFLPYMNLLTELDSEAQTLGDRPNIKRFVQLARANAFKGECGGDKNLIRKPWHFIPSLPEFTICEECYDENVWLSLRSKILPPTILRLMNKTIQLVPGEDEDLGSSCCLYSPRMRRIWNTAVKGEDLGYLKHKAVERRMMKMKLARERKAILKSMIGVERASREWDRATSELKALEREWALWE